MEFDEYKQEIKSRMSAIMENEATSDTIAFLQTMLNIMSEYGLSDGVTVLNMPDDIKAGSKLLHIDGYSFDETDHSLSLYICDYDSSEDAARLTTSMMDRLYWRMYYFLETASSEGLSRYMPTDGEPFKAANHIHYKMNRAISDSERVLKIHFVIITNRELDTKLLSQSFFDQEKKKGRKAPKSRKKQKTADFAGRQVDIDLWPLDRFYGIETADNNELIEIDFLDEFGSEGIPCLKGNIGDTLDYDAYIGIIPGKLLADIYIEYGSRVLEGNVRAFLGTKSAKGVNNGIKKTINNEPENFFTYNNGIDDVFEVMNLSPAERLEFVEVLNGDVYLLPARKRSFVVLRLDRFVSDKAAQYQNSIFSIEHVLPQTPKSSSQWLIDWPDADVREYWTHKIANLVPLTRKKNSQAQNFDFQDKKKKYISDKNGITSYVLATEILSENSWTPETVSKRQKRLIGVFSQNWELITVSSPSSDNNSSIPVSVEQSAEILLQEQLFKKIDEFFAANPATLLPRLPDKSLAVGQYVHQAVHALSESRFPLSDEQISKLCDIGFSKQYTRRNLAFLLDAEKADLESKQMKRYWVTPSYIETFNGKKYYVYSQWYGVKKASTDAHLSDFLRLYLDLALGKI